MMRSILLTAVLLLSAVLRMGAQEISVEDFKRQKKSLANGGKVETNKQMAIVDLITNEKGFVITANGKTPVEITEGEGMITVATPHKTRFLVIRHPDYGQTTWKPLKVLKRKKRYQAYLHTSSPKKQYHPGKQWVVFDIAPENAIITIDSVMEKVRNGKAQYYLPLGTHQYKIESPFHQAISDSVILEENGKARVQAVLQPFYSYLTVKAPSPQYAIYIDNERIGYGEITSGHLSPGNHQLSLRDKYVGNSYSYAKTLTLKAAEKRTIVLTDDSLHQPYLIDDRHQSVVTPANLTVTDMAVVDSSAAQPVETVPSTKPTAVKLIAPNDSTEIWLNRELLSTGSWEGELKQGFYMIETRQGAIKTEPSYFWVEGNFPVTLNLGTPHADYGMLSIHSNVIDAAIYINNVHVGTTPCIIERLPRGRVYEVHLEKKGYKAKNVKVKVRSNDLVDVNIKMKKK